MNTPNQTKEWLKFRQSQFADTDHIQTCRKAWIAHHENCHVCTEWIDSLAPFTPCPEGAVLYGEWQYSIEANPSCEFITLQEQQP